MQQTSCMHTARTERDTRERGEFSQWHRLLRKKIWVLLIGVEPTTFWLLVQMLFHILPSRHSKVFITQFGRGALWWGFISNFCIVPKSSETDKKTQEDKQRTKGEWYILKRMVETFLMLPWESHVLFPNNKNPLLSKQHVITVFRELPVRFTKG